MSLRHGILGFLNYGKQTGYELNKEFSSSVGYFWQATTSQIYRELDWLEKHDFVTYEVVIQSDKPNKKIYSITEKGKQEFLVWMEKPHYEAFFTMRNVFLMQVFFSGEQSYTQSIVMLDQCIEEIEKKKEILIRVGRKSIEEYKDKVEKGKEVYWELISNFGEQYLEMWLHWAKESKERLVKEIGGK